MSAVSLLLVFKILFSIVTLSVPFLLLPSAKLSRMTGVETRTPVLFRLYGIAITALLIGYAFGLWESMNGQFPTAALWMGLLSNGGAAAIVLTSPGSRAGKRFASIFGAIAIGIVAALAFSDLAMKPLF